MEVKHIFRRRIDFIWPSIAIYLSLVLLYSIIRGSIHNWEFTVLLNDPFIILFSVFIGLSSISYLFRRLNALQLIFTENYLIFKTNFNERRVHISEIESITFKQKVLPEYVQPYSIITIVFKDNSRTIHIWPPLYYDSEDLSYCLDKLKNQMEASNE